MSNPRSVKIVYTPKQRSLTLCRFSEIVPGEWELHQERLSRKAKDYMARSIMESTMLDGDVVAGTSRTIMQSEGRIAYRPWVIADGGRVTFQARFVVSESKLWPVLTAFADAGQRSIDLDTLRRALGRCS